MRRMNNKRETSIVSGQRWKSKHVIKTLHSRSATSQRKRKRLEWAARLSGIELQEPAHRMRIPEIKLNKLCQGSGTEAGRAVVGCVGERVPG